MKNRHFIPIYIHGVEMNIRRTVILVEYDV